MYYFEYNIVSGFNTILYVYDVFHPISCSVSSLTCTDINVDSYELHRMFPSFTGSTFHNEMIIVGIQIADNGDYAPRIDKMQVPHSNQDQSRRNLITISGIDSEPQQFSIGTDITSKDTQSYLMVNYNSGGVHDQKWRFVLAEVTTNSLDYTDTSNNAFNFYVDQSTASPSFQTCLGV